jgi:lysozyme family protein
MPFIPKEEGGYSNVPHDSGGMTMHGIIQREYDKYRTSKGLPHQWVKNISIDEQNEIYWTEYWLPWRANQRTSQGSLDLRSFNISVNGASARQPGLLQKALGISIDGTMGPVRRRRLRVRGQHRSISVAPSRPQFLCSVRRASGNGAG